MARESNKWKRKRLRDVPRKIVPASTTNLSASPTLNTTFDPEQTGSKKTGNALQLWLETNQDQTQVQRSLEDEEKNILSEGYVENWAAFADKYVQHFLSLTRSNFVSLVILAWLAFVG